MALFGGWVAYQIANQVNFSYVPTAAPFWMLSAAAMVTWAGVGEPTFLASFPRRLAIGLVTAAGVVLIAIAVPTIALPYLADAGYLSPLGASQRDQARTIISESRSLNPFVSVYAVAAGDLALNLDANGQPSSDADWTAAKDAYESAARLGNDSPEMFRHLAAVELHFSNRSAALAAARRALELDRYDPASQNLVRQLAGGRRFRRLPADRRQKGPKG